MGKILIDYKDNKFVIAIIPYLDNTFAVDSIEITKEAEFVIFNKERAEKIENAKNKWRALFKEK